MKDEISKDYFYWLAINGASCSMSNMSMPETVTVSPRPQMLVGFRTHKEAEAGRRIMLHDPIPKCRKVMAAWKKNPKVVTKSFKHPEHPIKGGITMWYEGEQG